MDQARLAELLAELDELGGQRAEALVGGDLLAGAVESVWRDRAGDCLAIGLKGQRPVGAVAGVLGVGTAAGGFAALQEALGEGAGPQLADGGEFGADLIQAVLQAGGVGRSGHESSCSYSLLY